MPVLSVIKNESTSVPIDVTVTSDRETVASRGEYTPAGDGFVLTFSIGDGKYEITHGESDTVLSVGGLLSYTISFAAAGAGTVVHDISVYIARAVTVTSRSVLVPPIVSA